MEATVSMEVSFIVKDPSALITEWLKLDHAKEVVVQEANNPINWASCILDIMTFKIDLEKYGVEFDSSVCNANPEAEAIRLSLSDVEEV